MSDSNNQPFGGGGNTTGGGGGGGGSPAGGGGGGGGGRGFSMMDGYANSQYVSALGTHYEGITDPSNRQFFSRPEQPPVGGIDRVRDWEPWVRASIGKFELLQGLGFTFNAQAKTATLKLGTADWVTMVQPTHDELIVEMTDVMNAATLRADRSAEILTQIDSQVAFWSSILQIRPDLTPATLEIMNLALQLAITVEMQFKNALGSLRPINFSHSVQPMITTPGHGSLPAGHATQPYMVAYILNRLLTTQAPFSTTGVVGTQQSTTEEMLYRSAFRVAYNRVIAGVHFPVDLAAGAMLGIALGEYFCNRCISIYANGDTICAPANPNPNFLGKKKITQDKLLFNAKRYQATRKNNWELVEIGSYKVVNKTVSASFPAASVTSYLWGQAQYEWRKYRVPAKTAPKFKIENLK